MNNKLDRYTMALKVYDQQDFDVQKYEVGMIVRIRYNSTLPSSCFGRAARIIWMASGCRSATGFHWRVDVDAGCGVWYVTGNDIVYDESLNQWNDINMESEENTMNNIKPTGFKEAAKIIINDRPYYYALYGSAGVKASDKVLVTGTANGRIHTVEDVVSAETALLENEQPLCAEVICKVDTSAYDARVKQREQKAKLRKLMEATVAQMDEVDKFRVYANHNPEMAKLLAQYNEINV